MHIYIDESGSFTFDVKEKLPWSVVGAYAVDEARLNDVEDALNALKLKVNAPEETELKSQDIDTKRPGPYLEFVRDLADIGGLFVPSIVFCPIDSKQFYMDVAERDRTLPHGDAGITSEKRLQLYLQANVLCELVNAALWGSVGYFSKFSASTLSEFHWFVDEKAKVDDFVNLYVRGYLSGEGTNFNYAPVRSTHLSLDVFYGFHGRADRAGFSVDKVLRKFRFVDSKTTVGVQIVDQLTGGLRRCLKQHWEDNELVAKALAALMIQQEPWLRITGQGHGVEGVRKSLLPITHKFERSVSTGSSVLDLLRIHAKRIA